MSSSSSSSSKYVDNERFDGLYMNVAQTTRGIEPLLDTVFSFLRRKTDFFSGPPGSGDNGTEVAIQKVNEVLSKHAELHRQSQRKKGQQSSGGGGGSNKKQTATTTKKKATEEKKPEPAAAAAKKEDDGDGVIEMGQDGGFDVSEEAAAAAEKAKPHAATESKKQPEGAEKPADDDDDAKKDEKDGDDDGKEKLPAPVGNGGIVEGKYVWTQTLAELNVTVPVPENTRGRDLNVTIGRKRLKVGLRSQPQGTWIIDAPLTKEVVCDDSFWTVEDGNRLVINLQKYNAMEWWDSVCQGHDKIDVQKIQPQDSSLGDLDGETRKTVEKMMYDQRQRALGRPTSEEEEKLAMLERFKKQHPEMDFSNAKIT